MRPATATPTRGFSLTEMLVAVSLIGLMSLFAWPKVATMYSQAQVRGARTSIVNALNSAKIAARQANRSSRFTVNGNQIQVLVNGATAFQQDLGSEFTVSLISTSTNIDFDPRGLVTPSGTTTTLVVVRGTFSDSVVVDGYGRIRR